MEIDTDLVEVKIRRRVLWYSKSHERRRCDLVLPASAYCAFVRTNRLEKCDFRGVWCHHHGVMTPLESFLWSQPGLYVAFRIFNQVRFLTDTLCQQSEMDLLRYLYYVEQQF